MICSSVIFSGKCTLLFGLFYFICSSFAKMYTAKQKIHKDKNADPTEFEESVAQVFKCFCCDQIYDIKAFCLDYVCFFSFITDFI